MKKPLHPPELFAWGRDGLPGEFRSYLHGLEMSVRQERGENIKYPVSIDFAGEGVSQAAMLMLTELREKRVPAHGKKEHFPKLSDKIAAMIYLLHLYCARCRQPAPPNLLCLTFEALRLKEGHPPRILRAGYPLGPFSKNSESSEISAAFLEAARLDGEADAAGIEQTASSIAKATKVDRKTVQRWRSQEQYKSRRAFCAYSSGMTQPDYGWDSIFSKRKKRSLRRGHSTP